MPRDKIRRGYLSAYVPDSVVRETAKRDGVKSRDKLDDIEDAVRGLQDTLTKQNRDNLDAVYNIDMDNLSVSLRRLFASYDNGISDAMAEIKVWADAQEAGFSAIASWQDEVESSVAAVQAVADSNGAKITSLASWQSSAEEDIDGLISSVAVIEQTADDNGASISQIVQAVGADGRVTAASIVTAVNKSGSSVKISADKVDIDGIVTFSDLEGDGQSVVNGNNISLIADASGDSMSELTFYKWRYTDDTEDDYTPDNMFRIYTVDNDTDDDDRARYAAVLETLSAYENSTRYSVALKLISYGSMSFESGYLIYLEASKQVIINNGVAPTRIRADSNAYYVESAVPSNCYAFCSDGIYYGSKKIVDNTIEA